MIYKHMSVTIPIVASCTIKKGFRKYVAIYDHDLSIILSQETYDVLVQKKAF